MHPIATRQFTDRDGHSVELRVYEPEVDSELSAWRCRVAVSMKAEEFTTSAVGEDSLQALILGLDLAKQETSFLSEHAGPFRWLGQVDLGFHFALVVPPEWRSQWPFDEGRA